MRLKLYFLSVIVISSCFSNIYAIDNVGDICEEAVSVFPVTPADCAQGEIIFNQEGCLEGANPQLGLPNLMCSDSDAPVVWFEVNFDVGAPENLITHVSASGFNPVWYVFSGNCDTLTMSGECSSADTIINNILTTPILSNSNGNLLTYYIAVTGMPLAGTDTISNYDFTLNYGAALACLACSGDTPLDCDNGLFTATVEGEFFDPDQDGIAGPFIRGQEVEVCWEINYNTTGSGNDWLHGFIPTFGNGWDIGASDITSQDIGGQWRWYSQDDPQCFPRLEGYNLPNICTYSEDGIIKLCNIVCNPTCPCATGENVLNAAPLENQSRLGSGWFWNTTACGDGDCPHQEYGVSGGVNIELQQCVLLKVKTEVESCEDNMDLSIFIQTMSDAVTGCWEDTSPCLVDPSVNSPAWRVDCCATILSTTIAEVCNVDTGFGPTLFDFTQLEVGSGTWVDVDATGIDLSDLTNVNFEGIPIGPYVFEFFASEECKDNHSLTIIVEDCTCPVIEVISSDQFCVLENTSIDLNSYIVESQVEGSWSVADNSGITLQGSLVDFTGFTAGMYLFNYIGDEQLEGCPLGLRELVLEIETVSTVNIIDTEVCNFNSGENTTIVDLNMQLAEGTSTGGIWSDLEGTTIDPVVNFFAEPAGEVKFVYTLDGVLCPSVSDTITVAVVECGCPLLELYDPTPICNEAGSMLDLRDYVFTNLPGQWSAGDGNTNLPDGTIVSFEGLAPDIYIYDYSWITPIDGCVSSGGIVVTVIQDLVVVEQNLDTICVNGDPNDNIINLSGLLSPETFVGVWEDTDATGVDLSNPMNVDFTGLPVDESYTFTFDILDAVNCTDLNNTVTITTKNCDPTSVQDIATNVNIYPNPFNRLLRVEYPEGQNIKMTVSDIRGKLIPVEVSERSGTYTLDFTSLSSGVFVLSIYEDGYVYNHKVVYVGE